MINSDKLASKMCLSRIWFCRWPTFIINRSWTWYQNRFHHQSSRCTKQLLKLIHWWTNSVWSKLLSNSLPPLHQTTVDKYSSKVDKKSSVCQTPPSNPFTSISSYCWIIKVTSSGFHLLKHQSSLKLNHFTIFLATSMKRILLKRLS